MKLRVIAITGSRDWTDDNAVSEVIQMERAIAQTKKATLVVLHGDCPTGADAIAEAICGLRGIHSLKCPARWSALGKGAGPQRNNVMAALKPACCYAFPLPSSRGTYDCINAMNMENVNCIAVSREAGSTVINKATPVGK